MGHVTNPLTLREIYDYIIEVDLNGTAGPQIDLGQILLAFGAAINAYGGGGGGAVSSVNAADTSLVVTPSTGPVTVRTNTLDVIATNHPPAASWSNNNHAITSLANGVNPADAAAFGQVPTSAGSIGGLLAVNNLSDVANAATSRGNLGAAPTASPTFTGTTTAPEYSASGLTGSMAATRWVGATASGAPTSGPHNVGDWIVDQSGAIWVCTVAGTPGTWANVGAGGSGTVTSVSVIGANGFGGSVANPTTTPAITVSTSVTGMVKGNGTALSAAVANTDYLPPASPTMTGTVTVPTPVAGDNSTAAASTAYVVQAQALFTSATLV